MAEKKKRKRKKGHKQGRKRCHGEKNLFHLQVTKNSLRIADKQRFGLTLHSSSKIH